MYTEEAIAPEKGSPAAHVPVVRLDPFSDEFLSQPYAFHDDLRDAGPVVWLEKYGIHAMARYAEVAATLKDWRTFCSGRGVGLADFSKEAPWRPPSLLLEVDPPLHDRTRLVVGRVLSAGSLQALRPLWQQIADSVVEKLVARGTFDAITELAEVYLLKVFPDAVGLRPDGRENLLPYGSLAFNSFGPRNNRTEDAVAKSAPLVAWVAASCKRSALTKGGFGMGVFEAADRGEVSEDEAERLVRSFLTAGVDTIVNGLGNMIAAFAAHSGQWQLLRENPELARKAFEEVLRWDSTVQTFFRTTTRDVEIGGINLPEGSKVLLFLAAANRDPRHWDDPEKFDVRRRTFGHVGFGAGVHACVGQAIARTEVESVLRALLKRVERIEFAGEPQRRLNNTLRSWASIPVRIHACGSNGFASTIQ